MNRPTLLKIGPARYEVDIFLKTYTIQKSTKWTWQAYNEQGIKIDKCSGPSAQKVLAKLESKLLTSSGNPRDLEARETSDEFESRGGKIIQLRPQRTLKPKPTGPLTAIKDLRPKKKKKVKNQSDSAPVRSRIRTQEGVVTLQEILEQFSITGAKARKILRGSDIKKPGKQWIWDRNSKGHKEVVDYFSSYLGMESEIKKKRKKK